MNSGQTPPNVHVTLKPWAFWLRLLGGLASTTLLVVVMWFHDSNRPLLDPTRLFTVALVAITSTASFLDTFVRRTLLMEEGVEYRNWFGKTLFFPYSELNVAKWKGDSIVLTDGVRKVKLRKLELKFPQAPGFLRRKIPRHLSPYPGY